MSLVRSLARRYSYRGEQLDDLVQIGAIGLIKAIDRFDVDRGVELTTYATPNIIGEIKRHFRDKGWSVRVPRGLQELNVQLSRIDRGADGAARALADDRRAGEGGRGRGGGGARGARERAARTARSRSRPAGGHDDDGELDPLESLGTEEPEYEVSEDRAVLAPGLPRRSTSASGRILHLRFFEGLTQSQIAAAGRHLADARLAADPPVAREDPRRDRDADERLRSARRRPRQPDAPSGTPASIAPCESPPVESQACARPPSCARASSPSSSRRATSAGPRPRSSRAPTTTRRC